MESYPERSQFFAHKAFRIMHKSSVAAEIGRDAFCIVAVVLHTEDAARYRGPVRFWNSQLMETLGFNKWETFDRARKKAVESGWLQYSGDGKRSAGLYFVTIPDAYANVNDEPIEQVLYPQNGYKEGYDQGYKEGYEAGIIGGIKAAQSGVRSGDDVGEPYIPIPDPNPIPKDKHIASDAAVAERDASPPPYSLIGSQFMAAFGGQVHLTDKRRAAIRQRWRDPWWRENWQRALEKASEVPFFHGQSQSGWKITFDFFLRSDSAVKIIEGNYGDNKTTGTNQNKNNNLTAAERREQLNADSFQYLRDAVAAQQQRTSGTGLGNSIPSSTGATLFLEEHGTAHAARG